MTLEPFEQPFRPDPGSTFDTLVTLACSTARADLSRNEACEVSCHLIRSDPSKNDVLWPFGPLGIHGSCLRYPFWDIVNVTLFWSKTCNGKCLLIIFQHLWILCFDLCSMIPSVIIITHQSISDSGASSCKINGGSATQEGSCHELVKFRGRALSREIWKLEYRMTISFKI